MPVAMSMRLGTDFAALVLGMVVMTAHAHIKYDQGPSDTEIKIGNTAAYSGPTSTYGAVGAS